MKLWLISQNVNQNYDTYDSAIVAAETEDLAKRMHPDTDISWIDDKGWAYKGNTFPAFSSWASPADIKAKLIGEAVDGVIGVVCASFNAG